MDKFCPAFKNQSNWSRNIFIAREKGKEYVEESIFSRRDVFETVLKVPKTKFVELKTSGDNV